MTDIRKCNLTTLELLDFDECFDGIDYALDYGDIDPWKQGLTSIYFFTAKL